MRPRRAPDRADSELVTQAAAGRPARARAALSQAAGLAGSRAHPRPGRPLPLGSEAASVLPGSVTVLRDYGN